MQRLGVEGMQSLYSQIFADPGEWSWVIVGAIPNDKIFHELIGKFLGISLSNVDEAPKPALSLTSHFPIFTAGKVAQVHHGLAEAATVCVCFDLDPKNLARASERLAAACAAEVAEARLMEQLRMVAGATYGVSCSVGFGSCELITKDRRPVLSIEFGCEPSAVDRCIGVLFEQLGVLTNATAPISNEELESCKEKERERLKTRERENAVWSGRLDLAVVKVRCGSTEEDVPISAIPAPPCGRQEISPTSLRSALKGILDRHERIESLTQVALQEKVACIFPPGRSVTVTLLPERLLADSQVKCVEDPCAKRQRIE